MTPSQTAGESRWTMSCCVMTQLQLPGRKDAEMVITGEVLTIKKRAALSQICHRSATICEEYLMLDVQRC
jgi:restriction endonuclease Mrr